MPAARRRRRFLVQDSGSARSRVREVKGRAVNQAMSRPAETGACNEWRGPLLGQGVEVRPFGLSEDPIEPLPAFRRAGAVGKVVRTA